MAGRPPEKKDRPPVLIYDGECRLCVSTKAWLERSGPGTSGSGIRFIPYQSEEAKQRLGQQYRPGHPEMAFLVEPSGDVREGLEAFLPLAPDVPGGRAFLKLMRLPLGATIAKWAYRVVARHRYRLFGPVHCPESRYER